MLLFAFLFINASPVFSAEKIGVLFLDSGEGEEYGIRWRVEYSDHLFIPWPAGFLAGRNGWEGSTTCYSHIHFARSMGYLDEESFRNFVELIDELRKMIAGYIKYLKKSKIGQDEPGAGIYEHTARYSLEPEDTDEQERIP